MDWTRKVNPVNPFQVQQLLPAGDTNSPVNATNQMYIFNIASIMGVEAWNSYSNAYPRPLQLIVGGDVGLSVTNELGNVTYTNHSIMSAVTNLSAYTWKGFTNLDYPQASFRIPLSNNVTFLQTNIVFLQSAIGFEGVPGVNPQYVGGTFPVPQWFVILRTRLRFIMVDTELNRIVDYISVDSSEQPLNLTYGLADNKAGAVSDGSAAGGWATNRIDNSNNQGKPTVGILNQILVGVGQININVDWNSYQPDPAAGPDLTKAKAVFKANLYYPTLPNSGGYIISNVFYAPFDPTRTIYQHVSWQANDPLVHYLKSDLTDLTVTNVGTTPFLFSTNFSIFGQINPRYKPWGGNPVKSPANDSDAYNLALKDPLISRSDKWSFPTDVSSDFSWIANVHRGTPWQTLYLKSPDIGTNANSLADWQKWTGNANSADAYYARPATDWQLVSTLAWLLSPSNSNQQISANNADTNAWRKVLDNLVVLTNTTPDALLSAFIPSPTFDFLTITSNSPQAGIIANAVCLNTNHPFLHPGEMFGTPELSVNSPFLNTSTTVQQQRGISDAAYGKLPVALLPLLRADSVGTVSATSGQLTVLFTGYDGYAYAIQVSTNFVDWETVSTNSSANGLVTFAEPIGTNYPSRYYRSILLP